MESEMTTYRFLSGAEMEPIAIREAWPEARFVARARIAVDGFAVSSAFASQIEDEVWGILVDSAGDKSGAPVQATTDDGRTIEALVSGDQVVDGEPDAALAAARYWELPPAYVGRLKTALAAVDEEPSDGN
jgi:hypothetical protein